jgi:adenylate cyclase
LNNPEKLKLGGERQELTVLFSDIAGFTTISEKLPPEQLVHLLNQYLTKMTNLVFEHQGVLDKYIGDAVMAFWGAPVEQSDHALKACQTALAMQEEVQRLKTEWHKEGIPDFDVRIGINTGEMIVGNMGANTRFDYTLIGDNVNLGSRLEGINKEYGTHIIIAQSTYTEAREHIVARKLDTVAVKGKSQGIVIYELIGLKSNYTGSLKFVEQFEAARSQYEKGKFKHALELFTALHEEYSVDFATNLYIERCEELIKNPLKDWDGVFHAKNK